MLYLSTDCIIQIKDKCYYAKSSHKLNAKMIESYPWPCPGVSLHQVGLELIHFVLSGGSHGGGVDLVHGVATQVGGQLNNDGGPPRAPLSHQHGVGGLVGWGYGPCQSTHLLYHCLQTTIMIQCKSHWYMSIFLFPFCPLFYVSFD